MKLVEEDKYDLVVVDTPPTRNAIDFLDAPKRLTRFLGHRLFQFLLMPTRAYLRAVSVATQALLRTISKVAGAEIVQDAVTFFQAFEGMEEGFRTRAEHMRRLLAKRTTAFVLVTSPREDTAGEAGWFADKLNESGLAVEGLIVNRMHPTFAPPSSVSAMVEAAKSGRGDQAENGSSGALPSRSAAGGARREPARLCGRTRARGADPRRSHGAGGPFSRRPCPSAGHRCDRHRGSRRRGGSHVRHRRAQFGTGAWRALA